MGVGGVSPQLEEGAPSCGASEVRPKWEQLEWKEKASGVEVKRVPKERAGCISSISPILSGRRLRRGDSEGGMGSNISQRE